METLTTFLASIVKPNGHIFTYDINKEFMKVAKKNLVKAQVDEFVTMTNQDIRQNVDIVRMNLMLQLWTLVILGLLLRLHIMH